MKITLEEGLSRLAKNPQVAAEFDRCSPGLSRREHVQKTIAAIDAAIAENVALKAKVSATKAKLQALEAARKSQSNFMQTPSKPTTAPTTGTITAAAFTKPQMTMARSEWSKLSTADKSRFFAEGGKLAEDPSPTKPTSKGGQLTREGLRQLTPRQQNEYFAKGNRLAE